MKDLELGFILLGNFSECQHGVILPLLICLSRNKKKTKNDIVFRSGYQNENSVIHAVPVILKKVLSHHNDIKTVEFICCLIICV